MLRTRIDWKVLWWALIERPPNKKYDDENSKGDQAKAATGPGKGDQPPLLEEIDDVTHLLLATDDAGERQG